jgi:hypothetical protein
VAAQVFNLPEHELTMRPGAGCCSMVSFRLLGGEFAYAVLE